MNRQQAAEDLARKFHEIYERFAPSFGYETRPETRVFDPHSTNGRLMIAVCDQLAREDGGIVALRRSLRVAKR